MASATTFASIKAAVRAIAPRSMEVPSWGATIYFKPVTPHEREVASSLVDPKAPITHFYAALVAVKAQDEKGACIFSNDQVKDMLDWPCEATFTEIALEMLKVPTLGEPGKSLRKAPT